LIQVVIQYDTSALRLRITVGNRGGFISMAPVAVLGFAECRIILLSWVARSPVC